MKKNSQFIELYKQGLCTHIYELTWSDKLKKIEILNVEFLFNKSIAIDTLDVGILIFKGNGYKLEVENSSIKKGTSYFFLTAKNALTWIKANRKKHIEELHERQEYYLQELTSIQDELRFYEEGLNEVTNLLEQDNNYFVEQISIKYKK